MTEREDIEIMIESEFGEYHPMIEEKDDVTEITFTGTSRTMMYIFNLNTLKKFCEAEGRNLFEWIRESILFNMEKTRFK
jgi:hypothetical protein